MGRALFSSRYGSHTTTKSTTPVLVPGEGDGLIRWTLSNPFDPDSDDFFAEAEFEAFVDVVGEVDTAEHRVEIDDGGIVVSDESGSESGSSSGRNTPITIATSTTRTLLLSPDDNVAIRASPAVDMDIAPATPMSSAHVPLPLVTPSPPPTVSPRIYVWGASTHHSHSHSHAHPASPTPIRHAHGHVRHVSAGPLTNPGARQSLVRIMDRRQDNIFNTEFMTNMNGLVPSGLDDFVDVGLFRGDADLNFERDFGQWFNPDDVGMDRRVVQNV